MPKGALTKLFAGRCCTAVGRAMPPSESREQPLLPASHLAGDAKVASPPTQGTCATIKAHTYTFPLLPLLSASFCSSGERVSGWLHF